MPPSPKMKTLVKGEHGEYRLEEQITQGNMSWSIRATDITHGNAKVFLKYYMSPTPKVSWFGEYVEYVSELNRRLEESKAAQYCVLCKDLFTANPRPGMCRDEYLYQAFDFIEGGDDLRVLMDKGDLPWDKRKAIALVFLACMRNIHEAHVVHCDLKPENIQMVPNPATTLGLIPRIIDMDRSILEDKTAPWTTGENPEGYTGTPGYMSPEHFNGKTPCSASDVFTIGLILSELLAGTKPFGRFTTQEAYKDAVTTGGKYEKIRLLGDLGGSAEKAAEFASMVESCFSPNPAARPICRELHKKLIELNRVAASPVEKRVLRLLGDWGSRDFRLDTDIGRDLLSCVSSDARFCAWSQFHVMRFNGEWYIAPPASLPPNATSLNGVPIEDTTKLSEGDTICLIGRTSGKTALHLLLREDLIIASRLRGIPDALIPE